MRENGKDREETRSRSFPLPLSRHSGKRTVFWTVAGFDSSNGAGITADLMTFAAHGGFGCSAITALTVQSTLGVFGWEAVRAELLRDTLRRLWEDLPAAGIKVGMLGTMEAAEVLGEFLEDCCGEYEAVGGVRSGAAVEFGAGSVSGWFGSPAGGEADALGGLDYAELGRVGAA